MDRDGVAKDGSRQQNPADLERDFAVFDRAIAQAEAGADIAETHPETGEPIVVRFLGREIVLSTASRSGFYRMKLGPGHESGRCSGPGNG